MSTPRAVVVVLSYNGRELVLGALASVTRLRGPAHEVLVVDNGSTDGTAEAVARAFPGVLVARTECNLGISGGYNLGMRRALELGAEFVLLLNNDVEADPGLLEELVRLAERDPRIGAVGCKTYHHDDRRRIFSAGGILRFRESVTKERGAGEIDRGQYDRDEERLYMNGNGLLIRRAAIEQAGWWDPSLRFAVEDADWCARARARGFSIWYAHRAVLYHMVSRTIGGYVARRTFNSGRASALFLRRHGRPWQWASYLLCHALALPLAFLRELPRGNQGAAWAKAKGVLAGLTEPLATPPGPDAPVELRERAA